MELESEHGMRINLSAAQRGAIRSFRADDKRYLRIEGREVTSEEVDNVLHLLRNPEMLLNLKNDALDKNGRVYRGTKKADDLSTQQLRNLACAACFPTNGLLAVYNCFDGELSALERECTKQAKAGPSAFNKFVINMGGDGMVAENHPAFVVRDSWSYPLLLQQGMCLQAQKRSFFDPDPSTVTGKFSQAVGHTSSFEGGPIGKMNRTLHSCVKIVTDRDGTSIPHCAPLASLRPDLQATATIVEKAWAKSILHHFPNCPGVGVFRGGDISQAGSSRNKVQGLTSVGRREAHLFWGNHQSLGLGNADALESSARGDLELYRKCKDGRSGVTDDAVDNRMLDIIGGVISIHCERNGATENDERRCDELEEARLDSDPKRAREVAHNVGLEIAGKVTRTTADCAAGGKASIRKRKEDPVKYKADCSDGAQTWHEKDGNMVAAGTEGAVKRATGGVSKKAQTWHEKDGKMVAAGTEGAVKRATGGASKKGKASIRKRKEDPVKYKADCSDAAQTWHEKDGKMVAAGTEGAVKRATRGASKKGAIGDTRKKAIGAASGPGNVRGSKVCYAGLLVDRPSDLRDVGLFCSKCKADWRGFPGAGNGGVPQGVWISTTEFVFQERRHWGCKSRCKPPSAYRSWQDRQIRLAFHAGKLKPRNEY